MIEYIGVSGGRGCDDMGGDPMEAAPYVVGGLLVAGLFLLLLFRR